MHRPIAALLALMVLFAAAPVARAADVAADVAASPAREAPEIRPFTSAHFGLAGTIKLDGITVDVLGEGDLAPPDRQRSSFKFGPFTAEVVMVGNAVYTRTRFQPRWSRETSPESVEIGPLSASELTKLGDDTRLVGTELIGGVPTQHYTSNLDLSGLVDPLLPVVQDRDVRTALTSLKGSVDVWIGASDRMVRQERVMLSVRLPSIEPNGDPMDGVIDLTVGYSKLNEDVVIRAPARDDTSPLLSPRPNVAPVVGPAGSPATSTGTVPGTGGPAPSNTARPPVQAPAQVPRR
ncbi:MAG: hypothetical protein U0893_02895 [Chloroflexota bacterium]